jgi:hypothetical protein
MDGTARVPEGLPRVERSFESSRLSGQFVSLAYEQAVEIAQGEAKAWNKDHRGRSRYESIGTNYERRCGVGG